MADFRDIRYRSSDDRLTLYARDYDSAGPDAPAVLCLHGLTRNSADFDDVARHLGARYRVIAADQRGRGRSEWDPDPVHYQPAIYVQDMLALLDHLGIERVIVIGTSMGGLMAMIMGVMAPQRLAAAVLNDIGPELDPSGLARIAGYAGKTKPARNWADAARIAGFINGQAFPDYTEADWMAFARRLFVEDASGVPVPAYDPAIARGLQPGTDAPVAPPDLWAMWDALKALPMLAVRGGLSDLLSAETLDRMAERHPGLMVVTIPNRGHAPMLDEPLARDAIDLFLLRLRVPA